LGSVAQLKSKMADMMLMGKIPYGWRFPQFFLLAPQKYLSRLGWYV